MPEKVNACNRFFWTDERVARLKDLLSKGFSDMRIAILIGNNCTEGRVQYARNCLHETGEVFKERKGNPYTPEDDAFIERAYCREAWLTIEIAEALGRNDGSVRARILKLGLSRENDQEIQRILSERRSERHKEAAQRHKTPSLNKLWTARTERDRAKLYNGHRYEDASVPSFIPRCGRLG